MSDHTTRIGLLAREDPPARTRRNSHMAKILDLIPQLRGERGVWFLVAEFPNASSAYTTGRKVAEKHEGKIEYQAVADKAASTSKLYLRWVGTRATTGSDR